MAQRKKIAFDFDGVLCDGLAEYFYSAVIAHQQVFRQTPSEEDLEKICPAFYELRPVIETGWEMVAMIEILWRGGSTKDIWQGWSKVLEIELDGWDIDRKTLITALDEVRDRQIKTELDHWLSLHRFYDGMLAGLGRLVAAPEIDVYIITTKEARFAHKLLKQQGIDFPQENIFGKGTKQPKSTTLQQLMTDVSESFWFIEDRLKTLDKVRLVSALNHLELFLATWGYNRPSDSENLAAKNITAVNLDVWDVKITEFLAA